MAEIISGVDNYNTAGPYGRSDGGSTGPYTSTRTTVVTQIDAYADSSYIYGIKLYWGTTSSSCMYGSTNNLRVQSFVCTNDPVREIQYYCDDGYLRGLKFRTVSNRTFTIGKTGGFKYAFTNCKDVFTDMKVFKGKPKSVEIIWGATFYYTGPTNQDKTIRKSSGNTDLLAGEMSWPALAVLAHGTVVAKSLMKVGKLRGQLSIKAPSCDPPLTTSPADSQLWYRTFRAQENCKETFLIYLPSILIASTLGYHAFGKWVPRTVGTLAFAGAFFRYKYLEAYIEDADKRGKPFYYAHMCMRPVFLLAVLSAGYLLGKELYHCVMGYAKPSSKETEEEEEEE